MRRMSSNARHTPVLYPLPETREADLSPEATLRTPDMALPRQHSNPLPERQDSLSAKTAKRVAIRSANSFPATGNLQPIIVASGSNSTTPDLEELYPSSSAPTRSNEIYSFFQRKFRQEEVDPSAKIAPGLAYLQQPSFLRHDLSDSDEEDIKPANYSKQDVIVIPDHDVLRSSRTPVTASSNVKGKRKDDNALTELQLANLTQTERERLEWQTMLTSVLDGEVFRSEKSRIVVALDKSEEVNTGADIWLGVRAWLRGRTELEEKMRLNDRRNRVVTMVYDEIKSFRAIREINTDTGEMPPPVIDQVSRLLERLEVARSLYPSGRAMHEDKPELATQDSRDRVETLISWEKLHGSLHQQIRALQRWTGSESLDVRQPVKSADVGLVGEAADHGELTTFLDRIHKEDSLQRTFEKGTLLTLHALIESARRVVIIRSPIFRKLNLPSFEEELVQLISFPKRLIVASLQLRLSSARLVKDPNLMVLDTMTEDFRLAIALACTLKREYEAQMEEDPAGYWKLPPCIPDQYDAVLLEAVLLFFKLLHWRLKSGTKAIYFKETDVLDAQEDIMDEVSLTIEGGAAVIAEQLCGLVNRLISRVTTYYSSQIALPAATLRTNSTRTSPQRTKRSWAVDDVDFDQALAEKEEPFVWLARVLDSVRLRYRKIQRYARALQQRFSNSAEYDLDSVNLNDFIRQLVASNHFLVYTDTFEEDGLYIVASDGLRGRPYIIRDMLLKSYNLDRSGHEGSRTSSGYDSEGEENEDDPAYIIVLAPSHPFLWSGLVMMLSLPKIELLMPPSTARLIADGAQTRLGAAKKLFAASLASSNTSSPSSVSTPDTPSGSVQSVFTPVVLECTVDQRAHLPNVNRELQKISKGTAKLAETIVASVGEVKQTLRVSQQYQELMENWFTFASDHGEHAQRHINSRSEPLYSQMLTKLAISWVTFICDDCDPTDRKTFRWAVTALEFAMSRTVGSSVLRIPRDEFALLRQKVASCMTLLISHFDILGARSSTEAARLAEEAKKSGGRPRDVRPTSPVTEVKNENQSLRLKWEDSLARLAQIDERRVEAESQRHVIGRVVDEEKLEDKSLLFLASSTSNISVRWQQGRFVGAGAFGSVYLAVNLDSGGLMAVKEIKFQDVSSMSTLFKQIKDELSVMEILQHPNIVEYYGIEVHRDKVFIFEEFCSGGSFASLLEHGRIEDELVLQVYTMQMLDGLAYLHSKGVIHRDIKPENILLDHLGVVKFVDFGASKIIVKGQQRTINRPNNAPRKDQPGLPPNSLTGTPMYMSPEVIKNDKRGRQGAMDIWSLGCVVLECATGRKPWNSTFDNEWAIMFQIGQGDRMPQLPEPWQLSASGISFIRACLTLDPMRRPAAEDMLNHPWMQSLRAELAGGDTSGVDIHQGLPNVGNSAIADPSIARNARAMEELQMEDILSSPRDEGDSMM